MMSPFSYHERFEGTQTLFRQRLTILEEAIPTAPEAVRPTLARIRRSAIDLRGKLAAIDIGPPLPSTSFGSIFCFDCGTRRMDTFHTSKQGGYHLCPTCLKDRVLVGRAKPVD